MEVKEYKDAQRFLNDYESILLEHESISQLILYSAYKSSENKITEQVLFGSVVKAGSPLLFFANVLPYNMAVYVVPEISELSSVVALADYFGNNHIVIHGIIARFDICREFIEEYKKLTMNQFKEIWGLDLMELRELNEMYLIEGTHRLAIPEEAKIVAEWMIEFQLEAFALELDYQAARTRADQLINENKVFFYENKENKVVTMAIALRKLPHGTTITYIYTPEEFRGNGYAAANIFNLTMNLLKTGNDYCTIFADKKNPLSERSYEKVGYEVIEQVYEYLLVSEE